MQKIKNSYNIILDLDKIKFITINYAAKYETLCYGALEDNEFGHLCRLKLSN